MAAAAEAGIECVPAVEMSCVHEYSEDLHMLGYWVDLDEIAPACDRAQQERVNRAQEIIERLNAHGVEVTFEDAVAKAGAADAIGRPHIAKAAGAGPDLGPFFEEYLVPGAKAFVARRWPSAEEAVELIHDAGGVAVVAHPYWDVPEPDQVRDLVESLVRDVGLDGIETFYPPHTTGTDASTASSSARSSASPRPARRTSTARRTRRSPASAPTTRTGSASRRSPEGLNDTSPGRGSCHMLCSQWG